MTTAAFKAQDAIIDTDIGTDIDDAYALLLALASPELSLKGITLVHADIEMRARIALEELSLAGRADVAVVFGESLPMNRERPLFWPGHEGRGLDFADIEPGLSSIRSGVRAAEFIARAASDQPGEVLLLTIGPMTNAGLAIRDYPREMSQLKGIVAMGSTFRGFGMESADIEHNIKLDPEAARIVLDSGIPTLLVGLNVTMQTGLTEDLVNRMADCDTPLARFMAHMTREWFGVVGRKSTCMHDPLAVAVAFESELVTSVPVGAEVSLEAEGLIAFHEGDEDSRVRICTGVDAERFQHLFESRIMERTGS